MIPKGAKLTIQNEYRHKLAEFRKKNFDTPMTQAIQWQNGAKWGYSLSLQEISSLNEKIEQLENQVRLKQKK